MGAWVWVGFLAFFVVSLCVGVRLLWLWRQTRGLPELCIGIGVLGIGPVGFGFSLGGLVVAGSQPLLGSTLLGIGLAAISAGATAKYVFNWRVYHPESRALGGLAIAAAGVLLCLYGYEFAHGRFTRLGEPGVPFLVRTIVQVGCLLWGSAEALRWWRLMGRRVAIGLGDPVVANRFLMWGVGAGAAGLGSLVGSVAQFATGLPSLEMPWVTVSSSLHGLVAAVALWFAFLPPARYRAWLAGRAAPAASD